MKKEIIALLTRQVEKLEDQDFDLEVWKTSVTSILQRILGESDPRVKSIEKLTIDYGSWALRDATAAYNPKETSKKKGREILNILIEEIDLLGIKTEIVDPEILLKDLLSEESITAIKMNSDLLSALKKEKKENLAFALKLIIESFKK